jgi:predicted transcriptional regulator
MADPTRTPMTAADVMTTNPRTCSAFSSVLEASLLFEDEDCGAVPVIDGGRPIGILTDRDVALAVANIPYAAMSETSSNSWNLSVINVFSGSAWVVERPSSTSSMAARNSVNVG